MKLKCHWMALKFEQCSQRKVAVNKKIVKHKISSLKKEKKKIENKWNGEDTTDRQTDQWVSRPVGTHKKVQHV